MMVLLAVTAATLNRQTGLQARRAANQTVVAQSYQGEVAAVEHAVWNLMQNPTWRTAAMTMIPLALTIWGRLTAA